MGDEDGGDVDAAFAAERDRETSLPLVEVGDDGLVELVGHVLERKFRLQPDITR